MQAQQLLLAMVLELRKQFGSPSWSENGVAELRPLKKGETWGNDDFSMFVQKDCKFIGGK